MVSLGALEPGEIVVLTVALVGLVPVMLRYSDDAKWFVVGYCCLVVGAIATNVEALFLGDLFNFVEHGVGLLGSGLAFAYAIYERRTSLLSESSGRHEGQRAEAAEVAEG